MIGWTIPEPSRLIGVPLAAIVLGGVALSWAWLCSLRAELEIQRLNGAEAQIREDVEMDRVEEPATAGTPFEDLTRRGLLRPMPSRQSRPSPIVGEFMAYMRLKSELERYAEGDDTDAVWYSPATFPHGQRRAG